MSMMMLSASMVLILLMLFMKELLTMRTKNKMNKSSFECGFMKTMENTTPFSVQFFVLSIMFIIFDIEISIMISMIKPTKKWNILEWGTPTFVFLTAMIMGIMYEWNESAMYWTK